MRERCSRTASTHRYEPWLCRTGHGRLRFSSALEQPLLSSKVLALAARRGISRVAGLLRVSTRPHSETHLRASGVGMMVRSRPAAGVSWKGYFD